MFAAVGPAGILVANIGGEEFDEAPGRALGGGDQRWHRQPGRRQDDEFGILFGHRACESPLSEST